MKHVLTCVLALCIFYSAKSQSSNYYNRMDHVFGARDHSKVTKIQMPLPGSLNNTTLANTDGMCNCLRHP
jgi:hypothetical protein